MANFDKIGLHEVFATVYELAIFATPSIELLYPLPYEPSLRQLPFQNFSLTLKSQPLRSNDFDGAGFLDFEVSRGFPSSGAPRAPDAPRLRASARVARTRLAVVRPLVGDVEERVQRVVVSDADVVGTSMADLVMLRDRLQVYEVEVEVGGDALAESPHLVEALGVRGEKDGRHAEGAELQVVHFRVALVARLPVFTRGQALEFHVDVMKGSAISQRVATINLVGQRLTVDVETEDATLGRHPPAKHEKKEAEKDGDGELALKPHVHVVIGSIVPFLV